MSMKYATLLISCAGLLALSACNSPSPTVPVPLLAQQNTGVLNPQLVGPLSQALNSALQSARQARTPDEARRLATQRFFSEISRLLQRPLSEKDVQWQVQSQWSATGNIQMQLQAQISDHDLTAQAQQQDVFAPRS